MLGQPGARPIRAGGTGKGAAPRGNLASRQWPTDAVLKRLIAGARTTAERQPSPPSQGLGILYENCESLERPATAEDSPPRHATPGRRRSSGWPPRRRAAA